MTAVLAPQKPNLSGKINSVFSGRAVRVALFAAIAAGNLKKYGWRQAVVDPDSNSIRAEIDKALDDPKVNILSLVFPAVATVDRLLRLIHELKTTPGMTVEKTIHGGWVCFGVRAHFDGLQSWVSGFGPFKFLPMTRQSPHSELALRVKPRPNFDYVMKESPDGIVHLADLDMIDMPDDLFRRMWHGAFKSTKSVLGKSPDLLSAAKTTYAVPCEYLHAYRN